MVIDIVTINTENITGKYKITNESLKVDFKQYLTSVNYSD